MYDHQPADGRRRRPLPPTRVRPMTALTDAAPALAAGDVLDCTLLYIDGAWVPSDGAGRIEVRNPATEQVIAVVAEGTATDVD